MIVGALEAKRAAGTAPKPVLKSQPEQGVVVIAIRYSQGVIPMCMDGNR